MKTSYKILVLILAVFIAVGGILIFVKTQLAPPGDVNFKDPFSAPLNADVEKVGKKAFPQCKDDFAKAYHKVKFMKQEQLLSPDESNQIITKIDTVYGNRLVTFAYRIFNSTAWPQGDLDLISSTMSGLRADKLSNGSKAITGEMESSFSGIDRILSDYRQAMAFAKNTSFRSVADASQRISSIPTYRDKPYIRNNSALMAALDALPGALANAHYNHVAAQINRLGGYRGMSEDSYYDNLVPQVERAIQEYKNTNIYGGHKKSADGLYNKAQAFLDNASNYYSESFVWD